MSTFASKTPTRPSPTPRKKGQILKIPIAHSDGNYNCDADTLDALEKNHQVLFRYTTPDGKDDDDVAQALLPVHPISAGNPNGSMNDIAGICNRERNVAGLMPHPERAVESALNSEDGLVILHSMVEALVGAVGPGKDYDSEFHGHLRGVMREELF